jgi:nitrate/nitrite transport system ATP-binding protein
MITHDVDEALLLADRILLMTNGPEARVAEVVVNTLPRTRTRQEIHHHPHYYLIRNHLVDFLMHRSRTLQERGDGGPANDDPPEVVMPGLAAGEELPASPRAHFLKQVK